MASRHKLVLEQPFNLTAIRYRGSLVVKSNNVAGKTESLSSSSFDFSLFYPLPSKFLDC